MIYHYTSIGSLVSILKSKSIRCTRLDLVDDPEEYQFEKNGKNPAKYVYISCWTRNSNENIPQWKLYANGSRGVRIGMDESMFGIIKDKDGYCNLFPNDYFDDKGYYFIPFYDQANILYDIKYVNNPADKYASIFPNYGDDGSIVDFKEVGVYKSLGWAFQEECRFKLWVTSEKGYEGIKYINDNKDLNYDYIDIPIKTNVLNNMIVTLGPETNDSDRFIVEAILEKYIGKENFKINGDRKIVYS